MPNAEPYGSGTALVFDTSAWNRRTDPAVLPRWAATRDGELRGERRLPAADYMIAAAAAERGFAVLHYDRHFEPLSRVLGIESIWIAEPGSID